MTDFVPLRRLHRAPGTWILLGCLTTLTGCDGSGAPEAATAEPEVTLAPAIRVTVVPVVESQIVGAGDVTGVVTAFRTATVAAEVGGRVVRRAVEPGARLVAGDLLVELDRERAHLEVKQAEAQVNSRRVDAAHAEHEFKRAQELLTRDVVSQDVLDDQRFAFQRAVADLQAAEQTLASSQRNLRDTRVEAPFAGTAEVIYVQEGDYLGPGTAVALIADFSRARLRAGVTAADAARIEPGQQAELGFEALGGALLEGTIQSVARIKDAASGTYPVEIWLEPDAAGQLREGMVAAVQLPFQAEAAQPTIPRSALFRRGGELRVFTVSDGVAVSRPIQVGRSQDNIVQVVDGLEPGEQVVVDGLFALRDGADVVTETLSGPP